jgi:hypothetical protein
MKVELVFDRDCPNVEAARSSVIAALARAGLPATWTEWDRDAAGTPQRLRGFGSPTVLVNGVDVTGAPPAGSACCRVYRTKEGRMFGAPPAELVLAALGGAQGGQGTPSWHRPLPVVAAAGVSLLPKLACPACWPAYAGLLSSVGLGALASSRYLFPLTAVFLAVALCSLGFRAARRHGLGPFFAGLAASAAVLGGKFVVGSDALTYGGVGLLVAASLWNSWPRSAAPGSCPARAQGGARSINGARRS